MFSSVEGTNLTPSHKVTISNTSIQIIPNEIIDAILEKLDPSSLANASLVCKHWNLLTQRHLERLFETHVKVRKRFLKQLNSGVLLQDLEFNGLTRSEMIHQIRFSIARALKSNPTSFFRIDLSAQSKYEESALDTSYRQLAFDYFKGRRKLSNITDVGLIRAVHPIPTHNFCLFSQVLPKLKSISMLSLELLLPFENREKCLCALNESLAKCQSLEVLFVTHIHLPEGNGDEEEDNASLHDLEGALLALPKLRVLYLTGLQKQPTSKDIQTLKKVLRERSQNPSVTPIRVINFLCYGLPAHVADELAEFLKNYNDELQVYFSDLSAFSGYAKGRLLDAINANPRIQLIDPL